MYKLPLEDKVGLLIAEKKMGFDIWRAGIFCSHPGKRKYAQMVAFRKFNNYRTNCFLKNGGGKKFIPPEKIVSKYDSDLLDLSAFCMDGQSVHPDVIYDFQNECYIMVVSQFPFKNDAYEDPILLFSSDANDWELREKYHFNISPIPKNVLGYHSDPGIFIHKDKLYFYDRKVLINKDGSAKIDVELYVLEDNPVYKKTIFSIDTNWDNHEKLLSPTIISGENVIHCWYSERGTEGFAIVHTVFSHDWENHSSEVCIVEGLNDDEFIWHLDICFYESVLYMAADIRKGNQHTILLFYSTDQGKTWCRSKLLAFSEEGFSEKGVYRGSILFKDNECLLFYSGRNYYEYWQTAKKVIPIDNLLK